MSETRYLEDFIIGEAWESEPVTLTADDMIAYAKVNDPQPMHIDPERAKTGPFGTIVASGFQIAALSMRMFIQAGGYGATPVVGMGIDELRWLKPVRPNDTLIVRRELIEVKRSETRPDVGMLRTRVTVRNQNSETVMSLFALGRVPARTKG
jgi:acyl dehydratase